MSEPVQANLTVSTQLSSIALTSIIYMTERDPVTKEEKEDNLSRAGDLF